ncbi:MAG: glycolate oxidase subunit GlcF [Proteobacteria bacterium]|nr:glycolate oxidase subunit GlcF [Pseudomonadota bacterium]
MKTALDPAIKDTPEGIAADAILRSCVHCGFCLPACPTYQLLGDELDSPRGRIYLMKQLLEGRGVSASTQLHLDRCLGCRACESACPSGVQYGRLLEFGRALTEERVGRPAVVAAKRRLLGKIVPHTGRARKLLRAARWLRPAMPGALRSQVPETPPPPGERTLAWPAPRHARRVVIVSGCVQPTLGPGIDPAAARVLDRVGISAVASTGTGCCGAVSQHLSAHADALAQVRRNVDALSRQLEAGAEALVFTASACSAMLADYGRLLAHDALYAERAARVSAAARDVSQLIAAESVALRGVLRESARSQVPRTPQRVAFQAPCTLQHALSLNGVIEPLLLAAGFALTPVTDKQRCCGSAGTYSILQPQLSQQLLRAKVEALAAGDPDVIATANVGCLHHMRSGTSIPVRHWVELLDERLALD